MQYRHLFAETRAVPVSESKTSCLLCFERAALRNGLQLGVNIYAAAIAAILQCALLGADVKGPSGMTLAEQSDWSAPSENGSPILLLARVKNYAVLHAAFIHLHAQTGSCVWTCVLVRM